MFKECSVCHQSLDISLFSKDRRRKSGITGKCKQCKAAQDWRVSERTMPARTWTVPDLNILSLGAGVQSSTVLLMSCVGELPRLDAAIFADTGWEPPEVYEWLTSTLIPRAAEAEIPLYVVSNGDIRDRRGFMAVPAFIKREGRSRPSMLRRQCTREFKIAPVTQQLFLLSDRGRRNVSQWFGISADEIQRMSVSNRLYVQHHYPLVELGMTRDDCAEWLNTRGWSAPRSACIGCPYHSDHDWASMPDDQFREAVEFDDDLRAMTGLDVYLHRSCIPLRDVTFTGDGAAGEECAGYCWT